MKLKLIIFPLCFIALHAFGFEGSIKQAIKNYNGTGTNISMTWYLGAHQCRIDMAISGKDVNSNTVLIMDPASGTLKTYETSAKGGQQSYFQVSAASISGGISIVSVVNTAETKQINGYKCEKWTVVASTGVYNVWIAKDIDFDWSGYKDFLKTSVEVQALVNQGVKGFPMLTEPANGNSGASVETVSTQSPASDIFSVPSEYTLVVSAPQSKAPAKTK